MNGLIDARTSDALKVCQRLATGQGKLSLECGEHDPPPLDAERLAASAPPLDAATRKHVIAVARRGKSLGRNPRVFGIVGDSISVSPDFLWAFGGRSQRDVEIDPAIGELLKLEAGSSVVDWFRGGEAERVQGAPLDPFHAWRAARVGARASWATEGGEAAPVDELVRRLSPAIAVVTFGANDASVSAAPPEELADAFERNLERIITELEGQGVVVVIENEMRHGDQPGVKACPEDDPLANDWHVAVTQNANSARAAKVASDRSLPFVDVRYALDTAMNHGLGPDGVHPSVSPKGGGHLTRAGLDCGHNRRNAATLVELAHVVSTLLEAGVFPQPHDSSSQTTPSAR